MKPTYIMKEKIDPQTVIDAYYRADWYYQYCENSGQFMDGKKSVHDFEALRDVFYEQGGKTNELMSLLQTELSPNHAEILFHEGFKEVK